MVTTKIAKAARTLTFATVAGAAALSVATGIAQADATMGRLYGDPAAAAPYWRHQNLDDCAVMSAADVIGQLTGREPSERAIVAVASSTPSKVHPGSIYIPPANHKDPNSGNGTNPADLPALLRHYGIHAVVTDERHAAATGVPAGMEALERNLAGGHKVIVGLNAELIWHQPIENTTPNGQPRADHAVVVTGVDTAAGIVHLNDSGTKQGRDEQIPIRLFVKAWSTSEDQMTVTAETS